MKKIAYLFAMTIILSSCMSTKKSTTYKTKSMDISMFPKAKENQVRHVIELSPLKNEKEYKVEIFITKIVEVDNCNYHLLQGNFVGKSLTGWGYDYYEFHTNGMVSSTLMACPDSKLTKKKVASEAQFLDYNSKMPIVIYTPKGYEVQRKIWTVDKNL